MIVSLMLLIATGSLMSPAHRLKLKPRVGVIHHTSVVPSMRRGPMIKTPVNVLSPQMQVGASDDDILWAGYLVQSGIRVFPCGSDTQIYPQHFPPHVISHQWFPPDVINGLDIRDLLDNWASWFVDPIEESAESPSTLSEVDKDGLPAKFNQFKKFSQWRTLKYWPDDNAIVLYNMCFVIADPTEHFKQLGMSTEYLKVFPDALRVSGILEMVGLIPKDLEMTFLESGSSAVDASMLALGLFSRGKLWDDSRGSLRKKVDEQYGEQGTRPKQFGFDNLILGLGHSEQQLDVFLIQGIVNAPGLPDFSARVLLSKIEKYAQKEQKIVVVAKDAYTYSDGTDLESVDAGFTISDHYVRLGFEKVEKDDGSYELVYGCPSSSAEDLWVEDRQIMVGLNLWATD